MIESRAGYWGRPRSNNFGHNPYPLIDLMNEHYYELQALQVQREEKLNSQEFDKWKKEIKEQALKADGSNTPIARQWKKACFEQIVAGVNAELKDPEWNRNGEATQAIKDCLNVSVTYKKDRKTGEKIVEKQPEKNFFDLDLAIFVTLQLMLDNCLSPELKVDVIDKSTGKERYVIQALIKINSLRRLVSELN